MSSTSTPVVGATGKLNCSKTAVAGYLNDIRAKIHKFGNGGECITFTADADPDWQPISTILDRSLIEIVGEVDLLSAAPCVYKKVLNQLMSQFSNGREDLSKNHNQYCGDVGDFQSPSDLEDQLQYKPTEALGDKATQIFGYVCIGDVESALNELKNLQFMRANPLIGLLHPETDEAFGFVGNVFQFFISWATEKTHTEKDNVKAEDEIPSFCKLSTNTKLVLKVVRSHILRNFRYKTSLRVDILKEAVEGDSTVAEWWVTLAEACRRRRRDVPKHVRGKRPTIEEYQYIENALDLDDQNPFVQLGLLDCIIDCLRDARSAFTIRGTVYSANCETLAFMKESCRAILKRFPSSVKFHSQISDYFARFVTLCFFDIPFAEECLETAYKLNPRYPLTTHRLGIFSRMSKGALKVSFDWFKKTEKLDPYHFNAFMECVKNMIGLPDEYNAAEAIQEKLGIPSACSWGEMEILELLFYKGIAHFVRNELEEVLESWKLVAIHHQQLFRLADLDQTCGFYNWDEERISTDKLRVWMKEEKEKEHQNPDRKELVTLLYNLMIGNVEPGKPKFLAPSIGCSGILEQLKQL